MTTAETRMARSAIQAESSSCSTATCSDASIVSVRFWPGYPSSMTDGRVRHRVARGVALRGDDVSEAGEVVLVVLLHAVLALRPRG